MVFNAATDGPLDDLPLKITLPTSKLEKAKTACRGATNGRKGNTKWRFLPTTALTPGEQEMVIYGKDEDDTFIVAEDTIFTLNPFHQELGGHSWQHTGAGICQ